MDIKHIRNFCIIAHIDHGKSTLADRLLELTHTLSSKQMQSQVLDNMDLERERGITIKSHPIQMQYTHIDGTDYILNLIDTPGHVDFTYEVSRSLAACEGAILLVDATQGVEAQTVSNAYLAIDTDLTIIPIINKIDVQNADYEGVSKQVVDLLGCSKDEILYISAKEGNGIQDVLDVIIDKIPPPETTENNGTRALIFDSTFDQFRGVVPYVRIVDGYLEKGMSTQYFAKSGTHEITEVGVLKLNKMPITRLGAGDVGYVITNIKKVSEISVGDTLTVKNNLAEKPLPGYQPIKPMVFSGMYPIESKDFDDLRQSLEKLQLNDGALSFEPNTSTALGFGFRCGFLGPLHMEIVQERLEREFGMNLITTCPNVSYLVKTKEGNDIQINNPTDMPESGDIAYTESNDGNKYACSDIISDLEFSLTAIGPLYNDVTIGNSRTCENDIYSIHYIEVGVHVRTRARSWRI